MSNSLRKALTLAVLLAAVFGAPLAQSSPESLLKRSAVRTVTVSPDGQHLAMIRSDEEKDTLIIVRRGDMSVATGINAPAGQRFHAATWASATRLLVEGAEDRGPFADPLPTGALFVISVDGKLRRSLLAATDATTRLDTVVVNILTADPAHVLVTDQGKCTPPVCTEAEATTAQLVKVDIDSGEKTVVAEAPVADARFISRPDLGATLVTGRTANGRIQVQRLVNGQWSLISEFNPLSQPGVVPIALTAKEKALALGNRVDTIGLYNWNLDAGDTDEIKRDQHSDIDRLMFGSDGQTLLAVRTDPGFPTWHYLDESHPFVDTHQSLRAAFPESDVEVTSFTAGESEAVVRIHSDRNAGEFYIVNTATKARQLLVKARPWQAEDGLASAEPFQTAARDGFTLKGYVTTPGGEGPHPTVVMLHDEPYSSRATWWFDPEVQMLAERGFAVLQVNYRGSAGYGRAYAGAVMTNDRVVQRDIADATRWAIDRGIAAEESICVYGRGYGAFAAAKALTESRVLYQCAVGINGFYDLAASYTLPVSPVITPMRYLMTPTQLDLIDVSRSPTGRVDRIAAPVMVVGESDQSTRFVSVLSGAGKEVTTAGQLQSVADVGAVHRFIGQHLGGAAAPSTAEPQTFGRSLSTEQARDFQQIVARMRNDLDALGKRPALSDAAVDREVRRIVDRYDDKVRALVSDEQWQLYPEFKQDLVSRLANELNRIRVR